MLCEFRTRLVAGQAEQLRLETWLTQVRARGLLKVRGRQRPDSTPGLAAIRVLNRLALVGETLRHALDSLAVVAPDWRRAQAPHEWFDRHGYRIEHDHVPNTAAAREEWAATIGADGHWLRQAVEAATSLPWLQEIPAIQILRQGGVAPSTEPPGPLRWRTGQERAPSAEVIASPDEPDAR